jgi:hypothetical protein
VAIGWGWLLCACAGSAVRQPGRDVVAVSQHLGLLLCPELKVVSVDEEVSDEGRAKGVPNALKKVTARRQHTWALDSAATADGCDVHGITCTHESHAGRGSCEWKTVWLRIIRRPPMATLG